MISDEKARAMLSRANAAVIELEDVLASGALGAPQTTRVVMASLVTGLRIRLLLRSADAPDVLREAGALHDRWCGVARRIERERRSVRRTEEA